MELAGPLGHSPRVGMRGTIERKIDKKGEISLLNNLITVKDSHKNLGHAIW